MRRFLFAVAVCSIGGLSSQLPAQSTPPAPLVDRVGFPENYKTEFVPLFAFDRPDVRQIRVVYGNHRVTNSTPGQPYLYGSTLVMETYRAAADAQGNVLRDANGRFIRDALTAIFVMRKERGYGVEYEQNRTGEWEYVAFRPDRTYQTEPRGSFACAQCHLQAKEGRDWVFRPNLIFNNVEGSGVVPDGLMQHYAFLPATIRVKAGSVVTWYNDDEIDHQVAVTATGGQSPLMQQGATFRARFNVPGEFDVACRIHPNMRGKVVVEP